MIRLLLIFNLLLFPVALTAQIVSGNVHNDDGEAIPFANIMLYEKSDSTLLLGKTTDKDGFFEIKVKERGNCFLRVSCVGYQTKNIEIDATTLTVIMKPWTLGEVTVTGDRIKKDASADIFYISDSLRRASSNTLQLLEKLPGINVDFLTDAIKIGEHRDVPMMVEGRDVGLEYVRNLNPKRISRIEVLRYPKGKYGDTPIVMNVVLQNTYEGFDTSAHGKGMISLRNMHSHNADAGTTFTYATKKWNLYGDLEMKDKQIYEATSYEQSYEEIVDCTATEDNNHPNASNAFKDLNFSVGVDYKICPKHVVSLQSWIDRSKVKETKEYKDIDNSFKSNLSEDYNASNLTAGAFYRGSINERLFLSADMTYNYYDVDEKKQYTLYANLSNQKFEGKKNFWRTNANTKYIWSDKVATVIGYTFTKKDYNNFDLPSKENLFSSKETRHEAYSNIKVKPSKAFNFVFGSSLLYVGEKKDNHSDSHFSYMPLAKAYWQPFPLMSIYANYYCDVQHPNLDQLSTIAYQHNAYLWHQGNSELKARVMHYIQYRVELKNIIQLTYLYKDSSREITPWYSIEGEKVMETVVNGDYVHKYIGVNGEYNLPHLIGINFTANYQWHKRRAKVQSNWQNGHTWYFDLSAVWQTNKHITIMSEYFLRYDKVPLLQGEQYEEDEQLMLGLKASALKGRLSVVLVTTIPTNVISKRIYKEVIASDYKYITYNNKKVNNSLVLLSFRYNISKGKASKHQNTNNSEKEKNRL